MTCVDSSILLTHLKTLVNYNDKTGSLPLFLNAMGWLYVNV